MSNVTGQYRPEQILSISDIIDEYEKMIFVHFNVQYPK